MELFPFKNLSGFVYLYRSIDGRADQQRETRYRRQAAKKTSLDSVVGRADQDFRRCAK